VVSGAVTAVHEFRLPDVGEGLTEADILRWHVAPGDEVALNAIVVEIETAKSAVELPSPVAGTVIDVLAGQGETVAVGSVLFTVAPPGQVPPPSSGATTVGTSTGEETAPPETADDGSTSVLVGYGPAVAASARRPRRTPTAPDTVAAEASTPPPGVNTGHTTAKATRAKPPVRKLARDLGVDLGAVPGSGPQGTVTREDLITHHAESTAPMDTAQPADTPRDETTEQPGEVRTPIRGVRKATAQAMVTSAFTAPHVTEFLTVDATATMDLVARMKQDTTFDEVKLSPLLVVARAVLAAVRAHPDINASWDEKNQEIVRKATVNLGIAAATPRGLMVPNIKEADRLSTMALAMALADLTALAREGKTPPEAMAGGTITITNIGVFGIDAATPILNPGEAAILCFGAIRQTPWVHEGAVVPRWTTQLSLSFDHRLVDGELGSKVLATIGAILENPLWKLATA